VLNLSSPRTDTPPLPTLRGVRKALARKVQVQAEVEKNPLQTSLENVATKAIKLYPDEIKKRHPELLSWYKASLRHLDNNKNRRKFNGKRTTKTGKTRGSR
jgi:hypothetical protein